MTNAHSKLVNDVLRALGKRRDIRVWKQATGVATFGRRKVRFGLKGAADISGILDDGRRVEIECKTGNAKQSKEQRAFGEMIRRFGGVYVVVHSVEEAEDAFA